MPQKIIKPEDMIADDENEAVFDGVKVRKGTAAAVFANVKILTSKSVSFEEKRTAKRMIVELAPGLIAAGMHELVTWKNSEIQKIFEDTAKKLGK